VLESFVFLEADLAGHRLVDQLVDGVEAKVL
jgi:hypothetical protein